MKALLYSSATLLMIEEILPSSVMALYPTTVVARVQQAVSLLQTLISE